MNIFLSLFVVLTSYFLFQPEAMAASTENGTSPAIKRYCDKLDVYFKKYMWPKSKCEEFPWYHHRNSFKNEPIVWTIFGDVSDEESKDFANKDVTVIMCGVHGDEITPVKFCFDLMYYLRDQYNVLSNVLPGGEFHNKVVMVAPLVNPDSFFAPKPTRTNSRGVDPNRNFHTHDWHSQAHKLWDQRHSKDKRRHPGDKPNSEQEVVFQVNLIKRFNPDKIVSVHAPLTLIDYDGPTIVANNGLDGQKATNLLHQMSKDAKGYNIKNYPFFPGSLGNWAGQERDIPTYTLELPSSDSRKSKEFWELFKVPMHRLIIESLRHSKEQQSTASKLD